MFELHELQLIWWGIIALLLIGFALTDGFDIGAAILLPFVARTDSERRVVINSLAPHWDGNQVWLITAGGALFAAWPPVYATAFSGFYWALLLVLFALFLRPVGFDYRSKLDNPKWRNNWDWALFVGGLIPAIIFGVAFGNLFMGVGFDLDEFLRAEFDIPFLSLLSPFALLCGIVSLSMLTLHGASWLVMRTEGTLLLRCRKAQQISATVALISFALAGVWLTHGITGMTIIGDTVAGNPLAKLVAVNNPGWQQNFIDQPLLKLAPALGFAGLLLAFLAAKRGRWLGFAGTALAIIGILLTAGFALFPFILPSSMAPEHSLTVFDATSSQLTLNIMLWAAIIFVPIILCYTLWCYYKMWRIISTAHIEANTHSLY